MVCAGLLALTLSQSPGQVVGDTKLDLWTDPVGFLARTLHLWEPRGFAGQVQNQAYGYLFPMGPFAVLGHAVGLPAWVVQRCWWALLLIAAFLGTVLLARRLRIGTPTTVLAAGLAYALAPRMLTGLGATSVELIPMALAPWVLLPLVDVQRRGSARRAAAWSGVAVFCVGGVNAVATAAVLPLPVLWLLTRPAGPARRALAGWWALAVGLATAWWAGPLLLLGRYSPPFLDYIETAGTTTAPTDLLDVLRGTSHWVASLADVDGPLWPAGWSLVHDSVPVLGTLVLAAGGLVALTRRDLPHRPFLVLGVLAGAALVGMGHLATVDGVLADPLHTALDGVLAPLRNVHKFDPVLRLPLVLALAHLGGVLLADRRRSAGHARVLRGRGATVVIGGLVLALVASVAPAAAGTLARPGGFADIPVYWQQTADYLAGAADEGRALLVPGSSFGTYAWGDPGDEPLQPLAESAWEVRSAIPLSDPAHIRVLDALEQRLAAGQPSAGLAEYLGRAGIGFVVLRNDLDAGAAGSVRPVLVRQALLGSPGITPVASFGPGFPGDTSLFGTALDAGLAEPAPAVQVFAVADVAPRAWTTPLSEVATVTGGPDAVLPLADRGLVTDRATVLAGTTTAATGPVLVSDALQSRERSFGRIDGATSAALSAADPLRLRGPEPDYQVPAEADAVSVVRYTGGQPAASSSASDPGSAAGTDPAAQPWAAVDGDPATAWRPAVTGTGQQGRAWWSLTLDAPVTAGSISVTPAGATPPRELEVTTDTGTRTVQLTGTTQAQRVPLPPGSTSTIRLAAAAGFALTEVDVPGVVVTRTVVTPAPPGPARVYAFDAARGSAGCVVDSTGTPRCADRLVSVGEEPTGLDRTFTVDTSGRYDLTSTAVPRAGAALDQLLTGVGGGGYGVLATSAAVPDPRGSAVAAVDGDPTTTWLAAPDDRTPGLVVTWTTPQTLDGLRVVLPAALAAARPRAVDVDTGGIPALLPIADDGTVVFPPVTTDRLEVTFTLVQPLNSYDPYLGAATAMPVGVSELEVTGVTPPADGVVVDLPCGQGPEITLDGVARPTSVRTTVGELRRLSPVTPTLCADGAAIRLGPGEHRLAAGATDLFAVDSATLTAADAPADPVPARAAADVLRWDAEDRAVAVGARQVDTLLVVPENTNPGWTATLDGQALDAVAVDGWQQGYVLPAGPAGTVTLVFTPGDVYRAALVGGVAAVVLLGVLVAVPVRVTTRGRRRSGSTRAGSRGTVVLVVGVLVGMLMVGGWVAGTALLVLVVAGAAAGRRRAPLLGLVAGVALGSAGVLLLAAPDGTGTVRQVLAVVALAAVGAGVLPRPRGPRRTP